MWFLRESVQTAAERRRRASTPLGGVGRLPAVQFADILHDDGRLRWLQTIGNVNASSNNRPLLTHLAPSPSLALALGLRLGLGDSPRVRGGPWVTRWGH